MILSSDLSILPRLPKLRELYLHLRQPHVCSSSQGLYLGLIALHLRTNLLYLCQLLHNLTDVVFDFDLSAQRPLVEFITTTIYLFAAVV